MISTHTTIFLRLWGLAFLLALCSSQVRAGGRILEHQAALGAFNRLSHRATQTQQVASASQQQSTGLLQHPRISIIISSSSQAGSLAVASHTDRVQLLSSDASLFSRPATSTLKAHQMRKLHKARLLQSSQAARPRQQLQPILPEMLLARGYKGLAPAALRNWRQLADKLNTPGSNITIVTFGGSITGGVTCKLVGGGHLCGFQQHC
jgi:hypothetical protein